MENQVANLQKKNIKCNFLSSTKTAQERSSILLDIKSAVPALRLLFITPELLNTEGFMGTLKAMNSRGTLTLFAVDEAHCISSWSVQAWSLHSPWPHQFTLCFGRIQMMPMHLLLSKSHMQDKLSHPLH